MGRNCPTCGSETITRIKELECGTQTFENCPECPFSTALSSRTDIEERSNVYGGITAMRNRRKGRGY